MSKPLSILIIEDSEDDTLLLVRYLKRSGYELTWQRAENLQSVRDALKSQAWDIIISDHSLPGFDSRGVLLALEELGLDVPLIVLSGNLGEEAAVDALKAGARDYIVKGNPERLMPAIERELREAQARRERRQLEGQMRQMQKMESTGQLAAGLVHDFNNLLTVIGTNSNLLLTDPRLSPELTEMVKQIVTAAEGAARLTRQLRAFSRKQEMQAQHFNLNDVVNGASQMLGRLLGAALPLQLNLAPDLPAVFGDAGFIEQILLSLAVNARDAMPQGGRLTIGTAMKQLDAAGAQCNAEARPGSFVCMTVSDTGRGVAPEHLQKIFEPFFTTKEPGKGSGLGLATVFGNVKQHHGWIEVDSRAGQGTAFNIFFPVSGETAKAPVERSFSAVGPGGTETILIAEDEPELRLLAARILRGLGYRVWEAASGVEALKTWEECGVNVDLLLTDMVMPDGLTGKELAEKLRAQRPSLKVIYSSGYGPELVGEDVQLRADGNFLQKPYDSCKLAQTVRDCLDRRP